MKQRFLILGIGITLGFSTLMSPVINVAFANSDLEKKKEEVEQKKSNVQSEISDKENSLKSIKSEQKKTEDEIKRLDFAVADTNSKMDEKKAELDKTKKEIEKINKEIDVLKERIKKRDELLRDRMRSLQETGGMISYLDVLLGAQSFSDFLNRVTAVSTFVQADRDIIKSHQEDKALLEKTQTEAKELKVQQESQLSELAKLEATLKTQIAEKNKVMKQLEVKEEEAHSELVALEDMEAVLAAREKALQREIDEWKRQEEERKKREAEEAAAAAATGGNSGGDSGNSGNTHNPPAVSNGLFMNPTTGRLTSTMGERWGRMHWGIDIGKGGRTGNVPIVAAAAGTVIKASYSSGYGNVVMITHYLNGKEMTTVYAHQERMFVSVGQRVDKGQLIGYMGNTGNSTGPHLHFEIYDGPYTSGQYSGGHSNAVNPLNYVNFSW